MPIALLTDMSPDREDAWLWALAKAMPEEAVVSFGRLSASQRAEVRIAIVANPDPAQIRALPQLAFIQSLWAGVERIVGELGVASPPVARLVDPQMARVMAEAVLAWTFYLQRDMPAYRAQQQHRAWRPLPYRSPASITVGMLGVGQLGAAAAARLLEAGFGVIGWSRWPKTLPGMEVFSGSEGLKTVLATSDIVVCLLPLTAQTRGLLDAERIPLIKPGAGIINFARGPVIATDALIAALDAGHLSHAVLDVFDPEPLPDDSPLWDHPGVTVLPHISGPTDKASACAIVAENIRFFQSQGHPPASIDLARGY